MRGGRLSIGRKKAIQLGDYCLLERWKAKYWELAGYALGDLCTIEG